MNPFFFFLLKPLAFGDVQASDVEEAAEQVITESEQLKDEVIQSECGNKQDRLLKRDLLLDRLDRVMAPIYLLNETHPNDLIRTACQGAIEKLMNYGNALNLDESYYNALKTFSETEPDLSPIEARFLKKSMDYYLKNGFRLNQEDRQKLKELDEKLNLKELLFQKNISESNEFLVLTESELDGLPNDFIQSHRVPDGFKVTTQTPDYLPVMKFAKNETVRKRLYFLYLNRAEKKNLPLLDEILKLRHERASLLGFATYAAYGVSDVMAKEPKAIWSFIKELRDKVKGKADRDYQALCDFHGLNTIEPWSSSYYTNIYKERHFELNEEAVKAYFPLDRVFNGLFGLAETLYRVQIKENKELSVWAPEVRAFDLFQDGQKIAWFYLDLFPRPFKYSHAACFGLQQGVTGTNGQPPVAALVCNFTKPSENKPSLLTHHEVETLYHEFGHLMHQLLTTSPLSCFAGTNVVRDFVEMPSQIMENWVWEKAALKNFATHYLTGETIPDALIDKMLSVKHLNSGIATQQQLFYGALDMTFHDGYQPETPESTTQTLYNLQAEYTKFAPAKGTHMQASFGHLIGYAAGYYGYMWSKVYAEDMFSMFKEQGIFNPEVGERFRSTILAKGDTEEPMDLIKAFLGREPNMGAFLKSLGV